MKKLFRCVPLMLVVVSLGCFSLLGCGGGGDPEEEALPVEEEMDEPLPGDDPIVDEGEDG